MIAHANYLDLMTQAQIWDEFSTMEPNKHWYVVCYKLNTFDMHVAGASPKYEDLIRPMCEGHLQVLVVLNELVCSFVLDCDDGYNVKMRDTTVDRAIDRSIRKKKLVHVVTKSRRLTNKERQVAKTISLATRTHYIIDVSKTPIIVDVCSPHYVGEYNPDVGDSNQVRYIKKCKVATQKKIKNAVMKVPPPTKKCQRIMLNVEKCPWQVSWVCTCGGKKCRN
jgi:hypothetical protein